MMITLLLLNVGCQEIKNTSKGMNAFSIQNHHDQKLVNMMCDMLYFDLSVVLPLAHVLLTSFDMEFCTKAASETTLGDALVPSPQQKQLQ